MLVTDFIVEHNLPFYSTTTPPFQAKQECRFLALQHFPPLVYIDYIALHGTGVAGKFCTAVKYVLWF